VVPLAVLLCNVDERRHLAARTNPESLNENWTIARDRSKWKSRQLTLVVTERETGREVTYIGLADLGRWHGTHQEELIVSGLRRLSEAVRVGEVIAALPGYARKYFADEGDIPRKAGEVILAVLFALQPQLREVVQGLLQPEQPMEVRGAVGRLARQARDALGLAMQMTGLSRDPLNHWTQPENPDQQDGSFVQRLPEGRAHERDLISHDADRILDWLSVDLPRLAWRRYGKDNQRLCIADVDGKREETALGVDLIYYHETRASLTLVQYKVMERDADDWSYRPSGDGHIDRQLDRMRAVDQKCLQSALPGDDYRLSAAPCWVKLCRSEDVVPRTDELIRGMYLTRAYFERLKDDPDTPCRGKQGAVRFSYGTVPRYLDNTTFAQLVADGWIGSSGTGTDLIKEQIEASRAGQREPILAFASGDVPKARRTRERISGRAVA
jgi:hypothetical protein